MNMKTKKFNKLNNAEKLRILLGLLQNYTEGYFGDSFDIDQAMSVDISYLKGVIASLDASNKGSLMNHKNTAEQCLALQPKPFNPFF